MSAIRVIRKEQRLRVATIYEHKVAQFSGPLDAFIAHLLASKLTGVATIRLNQGSPYGLEFDFREISSEQIVIDNEPK